MIASFQVHQRQSLKISYSLRLKFEFLAPEFDSFTS